MADPFGFLKYPRKENPYRPVAERITDWQELQEPLPASERQEQAASAWAMPPFRESRSSPTQKATPHRRMQGQWSLL